MSTVVKVLRTTDKEIADMIIEELLQTTDFVHCKDQVEADKLLDRSMLHLKKMVRHRMKFGNWGFYE
jgi:hypothetical protein